MMKIIAILFMLSISSVAQLQHVLATPNFTQKNIKIIDIRTPGEWNETGIVKDSYTIMFFNEQGDYDVESFLTQLNMAVKYDEQFALICNVGSRTSIVADYLSNQLGYNVINLQGGIVHMMEKGYQTVPYQQ